ncbi:hypothetical protein [Kaistella rhinocerotis]|uniref:hypothetical protein n=1 Tax=Kaistella rhinocerotis TaxID=3026437 RepID=UPI002552EACA|nr:hypothetical protein [Kaistella sp. Ran72]
MPAHLVPVQQNLAPCRLHWTETRKDALQRIIIGRLSREDKVFQGFVHAEGK